MMAFGNRAEWQALTFMAFWLGMGAACPMAGGQVGSGESPPGEQTATTQATQEGIWLRVTATRVNLRSRPDANSTVVAWVERGDVLRAVGSDQYGWYRVLPPRGVFSLVSAEYVDRLGETEGIVSVRSGTLRVRVGSLVRELDPLKSEVQTLLKRGTPVRILGEQGDWLKIVPPPGAHVYVSGDYVEPVSEEVAGRLRAHAAVASRPASGGVSDSGGTVATRPAPGPDLSGPWGQRLALLEAAIQAEAGKPLLEQVWAEPIERLHSIAAQREEPTVARLARAWIVQLEQRELDQEVVRDAEEVRKQWVRDQTQHEREMERIERLRRRAASRPVFDVRGELLRSYAVDTRDGKRWYKLWNPLTRRLEAYVEIGPGSQIDPERYLGQYVGVRGDRRSEPGLGTDVYRAEQIVVLRSARPATATRPARQEP